MHLEEFIERLERGVAQGVRLAGGGPGLALGFRLDFPRAILVWWFKGQEADVRREFSATFEAVSKLIGEQDVDKLLFDMFEDEVRRLREVVARLRAARGEAKSEREEAEGRGELL